MAPMVEVLTSEMVVPAEETPRGSIWLSNLDLAGRRGYTPTVYFFRPPPPNGDDTPGFFAAEAIKHSLAMALVVFYPLAGRLGVASDGRIQVDCTAEGVVFATARSLYAMDELMHEFVPCDEMRDMLVPPITATTTLLFVQLTYLRCGGVVLGQAMHHSVVDARGAAHFFDTWASISRRGGAMLTVDVPPCFDHTLLAAARPHAVLYDHSEYKPESTDGGGVTTYASAIITMTKTEVTALKAKCPGASTFRAVVALVWQCVCRARALPAWTETKLYSMVDMRARLDPPLPEGYFGNAVVRTSVSATVGEVVSSPVVHAARLVRAATSQGNDYARSVVDYLEGVDAMNLPRSGISTAHLRAISWMGMSLHAADFGWGAPAFMGPALMYYSGFVYVMNAPASGKKDGAAGGIKLVMSLEPESMPEFRKVFGDELERLRT